MPNCFCHLMVAKKLDEVKAKKLQKESEQDKGKANNSIKEISPLDKGRIKQ